jgi:hypothetical protein
VLSLPYKKEGLMRRNVISGFVALGLLLIFMISPVSATNGFGTTRLALLDSHNHIPSDGNLGTQGYSSDGRYLFFSSKDGGLVDNDISNDTNDFPDIFRRDTISGAIEMINIGPSGAQLSSLVAPPGFGNVISGNLSSTNGNIVPFSYNGGCYYRDMNSATTTVFFPHTDAGPVCSMGAISGDGRYIAYWADVATTLSKQLFVYDRTTASSMLISKDTSGNYGNGNSDLTAFSSDGNTVIYRTSATNIDPAYPGQSGTVLYDMGTQTNSLLKDIDDAGCGIGGISADASRYALTCSFVGTDGKTRSGAAYYNVVNHSINTIANPQANTDLSSITAGPVSPDGTLVAVQYSQDNPVTAQDTNGFADGAFYDVTTGNIWRTGIGSDGQFANSTNSSPLSITADNSKYLFASDASNLVNITTGFAANVYEHLLTDNALDPTFDFKPPAVSKLTVTPNPVSSSQQSVISMKAVDHGDVARVEYYIDSDPGRGNGFVMTYGTKNFYNAVLNVPSPGNHTVYARAQDVSGNWSTILSAPMTVQ